MRMKKSKCSGILEYKPNKYLTHNMSDITVIEKNEKKAQTVNIAVPGASKIANKESKKITKYKDLQLELERCGLSNINSHRALDSIPKQLEKNLAPLGRAQITSFSYKRFPYYESACTPAIFVM